VDTNVAPTPLLSSAVPTPMLAATADGWMKEAVARLSLSLSLL
jgi:hypothetical protein